MAIAKNIDEWAVATAFFSRVQKPELWSFDTHPHPSAAVQSVMRQIFRPSSPVEEFSDDQPTFHPESPEDERLVPIDILLGCYIAAERRVRIFIRNIRHYADKTFRCDVADLEFIVRVHEYAHALVHLGVSLEEDRFLLMDYPAGAKTGWDTFIAKRNVAYNALDESSHEFLAQTISWVVLSTIHANFQTEGLQRLFVEVMEKQPEHYRLSKTVLDIATKSNWAVVLDWMRYREGLELPEGACQREAAESLVFRTRRSE